MKVLHLISSSGLFGAENVILNICSAMKDRDMCIPVVGLINNLKNPHLELADECRRAGIKTASFRCRSKLDLAAIKALRRFIISSDINIINSHGYKSDIFAFLAAIGSRCTLISTCHNWTDVNSKVKMYGMVDRFVLKYFDAVIAVSPSVQNKLHNGGVAAEIVKTIHNGVDLKRFSGNGREETRGELEIGRDKTVFGTVGRISAEKGQRYFLNAATRLLEVHPECEFVLAGDGPLTSGLKREFNARQIHFLGVRRDIEKVYAMIDIFVLPSLTEGLPMALLEAMAASCPVIATDVGAVSDVLGDGGMIIPPADETMLFNAMSLCLEIPERTAEMARMSRSRVENKYSAMAMAEKYMSTYRKALEVKKTGI